MPVSLSGYRYRLEPYPAQRAALARYSRASRWLWNWALGYRNEAWFAAKSAGATGISANLGYVHLSSLLTDLRKQHSWLRKVPVVILRGALKNLDRAFQNFFAGRGSYPRFKRRSEPEALSIFDGAHVGVHAGSVRLPVIGWIRFREHRPLIGNVRTVSLSREGEHWYVSFAAEGNFSLPNAGADAIGIDRGVTQSVTLSTGECVHLPIATPAEQKRLLRLQRQLSRRKNGSNRRRRTLQRAAKLKRHIVRRRQDAAHKLTTRLATTHRTIVIEDLRLRNMTAAAKGTKAAPGRNVKAKAGLNRVILEQGLGEIERMLTYKCQRSGARLIKVNPAYTSQTCSQCGHCAAENRQNQAAFLCTHCGLHLNADHNAALNILSAAGSAVAAQGGMDSSPADELRTHPRASAPLRSSGRRKTVLSVI